MNIFQVYLRSASIRATLCMSIFLLLSTNYSKVDELKLTILNISEKDISDLSGDKSRRGSQKRMYLINCIVEGDHPSEFGYNGGCRNLPIFLQYINMENDSIDLIEIFEFNPMAFTIVFSPKDHRIFESNMVVSKVKLFEDCTIFEMKAQNGTVALLQITERPKNVEVCIYSGFLKWLNVPLKINREIEYYRFVYNFVSNLGTTRFEIMGNIRKKMLKENVLIVEE